jgi:NDP-sugar pyrophosphorylase family protein
MIASAMVLAAGRGARMRPLSDALPKPALPLLSQPVVASPIRLAAEAGASTVTVNTWHLAEIMERALADVELDTELQVSREDRLMGTAGGMALARDRGLLGNRGPVLIVNGDGILNLDLEPMIHRMARSGDLITLGLLPHLDPHRWSRVVLDDNGLVARISKPGPPDPNEVPLLYPGVMLVSRKALDDLETSPGDIPKRLWGPALAGGRLGGVVVSGHWREVGTPADYLEAVIGRLNGDGEIDPSAVIHPSASIGSALVGRGARIDAGAVVGATVVAEGATVGRDARVLRSVLLGNVAARPGEVVVDEFRAAPPSSMIARR